MAQYLPVIFRLLPMQKTVFFICFFWSCCSYSAHAQEALPFINVKNINDRIIVSWINNYSKEATTLNIQRSYDSLRNFTTIGAVLYPGNIDNGFADTKAHYKKMYYRVFIAFAGGTYAFSEVKRPVQAAAEPVLTSGDSIALSFIIPEFNKSLKSVFIDRDNNVIIKLPDTDTKKYSIRFFDDSNNQVIEINKLPEQELILEKVNFIHAGWYTYKLIHNGALKETGTIYLPADNNIQPVTPRQQGKKNR